MKYRLHVTLSLATLMLGLALPTLLTAADAPAAPTGKEAELKALLSKYERAAATMPEADLVQMVKLGHAVAQPHRVAPILKAYLSANPTPSKQVLLAAAENAVDTVEYRVAVARYKAFIHASGNNVESSRAAAAMYAIMINFLNDAGDAYQFMDEFGDALRQSPEARRFDHWYLAQARAKNNMKSQVRRIAAILAGQLPLEMEQFYFWDDLDYVLSELRAKPFEPAVLAAGRDLPKLIRGDAIRSTRCGFYLALAESRNDEKKIEAAIQAGRAHFAASPTAAVLIDVCELLGAGGGGWAVENAKKQQLFNESFPRLSMEEKTKLLKTPTWMHNSVWHTEQAPDLLAGCPREFGNIGWRPFVEKPEVLKKQAALLAGLPLRQAAVINSLAAGNTLEECYRWFFTNETWYLPKEEFGRVLNEIWDNYRTIHAKDAPPITEQVAWDAATKTGLDGVARSPIAAFDHGLVRWYLENVWRSIGASADKTQFAQALEAVIWVPSEGKHRRNLASEMGRWVHDWSNQFKKSTEPAAVAALKQAEQLQNLVAQLNTENADPAKAPNPVCQKLSAAIQAQRAGREADHAKACQELYPMVREFEARKIPHGASLVRYSLATSTKVDSGAFHAQVIKEQLGTYSPFRFDTVIAGLFADRRLTQWELPREMESQARAMASAAAEVVMQQLGRNQFEPRVFDLMRQLRWQRHFKFEDIGNDVVEAMITRKTLMTVDYRPRPEYPSAAVGTMYIVAAEFPKLVTKYPLEGSFDDFFVEEATKTRFLDGAYMQWGRDPNKKIANVAAQVLQTFDRVPVGGETDKTGLYTRDSFLSWHTTAMGAEPAKRDPFLAKLEATYGKTRFDEWAMGRWYFPGAQTTDRKEYFAKIAQYVSRVRQVPNRLSPPPINVANLGKPEELTDAELDVLKSLVLDCMPQTWWGGNGWDYLPEIFIKAMMARNRQPELIDLAPGLWAMGEDTRNGGVLRVLGQFAEQQLSAKHESIAATFADAGLQIARSSLPDDLRSAMVSVRAQAVLGIGVSIPVDRDDPRYPVYLVQEAYRAGAMQNAWERYLPVAGKVPEMVKELDPKFSIWLIGQSARNQMFTQAEELARAMLVWTSGAGAVVDIEVAGELQLAYATIYIEKRDYIRGRAQLERVVTAAEFADTHARELAELKIAEVERLMKQYDKAQEMLDKLTRRTDRNTQTEAFYQLAVMKYDMEEYPESRQFLDQVFLRFPDHIEGRILEGNLDLKTKRLVEATEVKAGLTSAQQIIVPGKPLKVRLEDQNLATVGKAAQIEIHVWTASGDDEIINLVPFGDSKTKFEGGLPTEMAPTKKGDRILQVLGDDTVKYDYSEAFKKTHNIISAAFTLTVATDSGLSASSGRILSDAEIAERELAEMLREKLEIKKEQEGEKIALSLVRPASQVKPGNPINVRVTDPDRSVTAGVDKLAVRVTSSSGDVVEGFELTETGTHTGVFEGAIPTASAQATAYATDTEEGRSPNFVISAGGHPHWMGLPDNKRPKLFTVDLNENVQLGKMVMTGSVPGRKLKQFRVQTSMSGKEYTTRGSWPESFQPWGGELKMDIAKMTGSAGRGMVDGYREYMDVGYLMKGGKLTSVKPQSLSVVLDKGLMGRASELGLTENDTYLAHLKGGFYFPARQVRTFRLSLKSPESKASVMLFIDGEAVTAGTKGKGVEGPIEMKKSFAKGVHLMEVFVTGSIAEEVRFDVQWDIEQEPYFATCPADMFDPAKHPEIAAELAQKPIAITAGKGETEFELAFPAESRARVVRLVLQDFELDAPAISKISLTDAEGKRLLPTEQDLTQLTKNKILEIIPGDRITVRYDDPKVVTSGKNVHEESLQATYMDATIRACFPEYGQPNAEGQRSVSYVPIRRFRVGDTIAVIIQDADMDVSDKNDKVTFTAKTTGGKTLTFEALETAEHSGAFTANLFPVSTAPQRATELQVGPSDDVTVTYLDRENLQPGVAWERTDTVEQAVYIDPQMRAYDITSRALPEEEVVSSKVDGSKKSNTAKATGVDDDEAFTATRGLLAVRPTDVVTTNVSTALIDGPVFVEVLWPTAALSQNSRLTLFAQTSSGQAKTPPAAGIPFDVAVAGTIRLQTGPRDASASDMGPGYADIVIQGDTDALSPLDDGRFCFSIPTQLGEVPATSLALDEEEKKGANLNTLAIKGGDKIFVGFQYKDKEGKEHWFTRSIALGSDAFFDVMDRRYQEVVTGTHVGEKVYFRVVDKAKHVSPEKDTINVQLKTSSGGTRAVTLMETYESSGVFKGYVNFAHAKDAGAATDMFTMPVEYGDTVTISYTAIEGANPLSRQVAIYKGADGTVLPFTKRFKDPEIAVQTQFTMTEAYFELAKKHRELGEESLARREIGQGKKLLEEAIQDYPETGVQAQADYLLANLSLEFADMAVNEDAKRTHFLEAISRFTDIVANYPDSPYAAKSQFKKALTFEKMGETDQACEEYVKLSYRYPENELVAETISRLGLYFFSKGKAVIDSLEGIKDPIEREKVRMQSLDIFRTAAEVFGRLSVRFPTHQLAGLSIVLSGQCYMRAEELEKAVTVFKQVTEDSNADKGARAQAMYWCGDAYMRMTTSRTTLTSGADPLEEAYKMFTRLRWDYPESEWAKYARGRLTEQSLASFATRDK